MRRSIGIALSALALCCSSILPATAASGPAPITISGDDGLNSTCRALQLEVQAAVGNETRPRYRNHGAYVSTVAHMVGIHVGVDITEECASCIISQFARRIPIEDQRPCGPDSPNPECEGATCSTFLPCNLPNSCTAPVCGTLAEGGGLCVEGLTPCAGLIQCPGGTGDCPDGYLCFVESCCGVPVCMPPSTFCQPTAPGEAPATAKAAPAPDQRTFASGNVLNSDPTRVPWTRVKSLYKN